MGKTRDTGFLNNCVFTDSSNNVGIGGAANASYKLAVTGASLFSSSIALSASSGFPAVGLLNRSSDNNLYMVAASSGFVLLDNSQNTMYNATPTSHTWQISNSPKMTLNSSGNVGIGTSSPANRLHVYNTAVADAMQIESTQAFSTLAFRSSTNTSSVTYGIDGSGNAAIENKLSSGNLILLTASTERMRITSGGYTKMTNNGVISYPTGTIHELRQTAADYVYYSINANATPYGAFFDYTTAAPNGTGNSYIVCADTSVTRFAVRSNGGVYNYSANNVNLSDISTKKDIIPCESYWDKFKAIEIVKFKYIDQSHDDYNIGVIAQQVEQVAPEFIDVDDWSKPEEETKILKAVYTEDLHHATIKVLQEAMAKIEQLEAKVTALENQS